MPKNVSFISTTKLAEALQQIDSEYPARGSQQAARRLDALRTWAQTVGRELALLDLYNFIIKENNSVSDAADELGFSKTSFSQLMSFVRELSPQDGEIDPRDDKPFRFFLLLKYHESEYISAKEILDFTGWKLNTLKTYISKKRLSPWVSELSGDSVFRRQTPTFWPHFKARFTQVGGSTEEVKALTVTLTTLGEAVVRRVRSVSVTGFSCLSKIELTDLDKAGEIYFLGENGQGKTLLLQAITVAMRGSLDAGYIVDFLREISARDFEIRIITDDSQEFTLNDSSRKDRTLAANFFAYGVHRNSQLERKDDSGIITLFQDDYSPRSPEKWLQEIDYHSKSGSEDSLDIEIAKDFINTLLDNNARILDVSPKGVFCVERGHRTPFKLMSDGYKSAITWAIDLVSRLFEINPKAKHIYELCGIALIDEVDLFLHPKWAKTFIRKLRGLLPNVQFIVSTHSPILVLGASADAKFFKLSKKDGVTAASEPITSIKGMMSNTLVTSPLFDLDSAAASISNRSIDTADDYLTSRVVKKLSEKVRNLAEISENEIDDLIDQILNDEAGENA